MHLSAQTHSENPPEPTRVLRQFTQRMIEILNIFTLMGKRMKFGLKALYIYPVWAALVVIWVMCIYSLSFVAILLSSAFLFLGSGIWKNFVLQFDKDSYTCIRFFQKKKYNYSTIVKIQFDSSSKDASGSILLKYRNEQGKLVNADFEFGSRYYLAEVLNFIKERVDEKVIESGGFDSVGVKLAEGKYKY